MIGVIVGFVLGMVFLAFIQFIHKLLKIHPCNKTIDIDKNCYLQIGHEGECKVYIPYKQCPAVLRSGHQCKFQSGHSNYHKTLIHSDTGFNSQEYCWNDPNNGLYGIGFFYH